jgi:hypothetical protein
VERRALHALAIELRTLLQSARTPQPTTVLLRFSAGDGAAESIDLLLLRPSAVIVGAVRAYRGPIVARPGDRWTYRDTGEPIREARDRTPIQHVKFQRDAVRARLDQAAAQLVDLPAPAASAAPPSTRALPGATPFERTIGALIVAPATHPESRVSLDVGDHRQQLKVLGLDELAGLAAMARLGVQLPDDAMHVIALELFGGRLWHDGAKFLFDLAPARFRLRVLASPSASRGEKVFRLLEGENVVGRRRAAQKYEHRVALSGDELISGDHALIVCGDDDHVTLRDISKNGTWITPAGGVEERVRGERALFPGTLLRMGDTRLRLERAEEIQPEVE